MTRKALNDMYQGGVEEEAEVHPTFKKLTEDGKLVEALKLISSAIESESRADTPPSDEQPSDEVEGEEEAPTNE
jgi:hypothetical protein